MQRRVKTYGKRGTRIITVNNNTTSTTSAIISTQSTSTINHVSDSSDSSDDLPSTRPQSKDIPHIDYKKRKPASESKDQPVATRHNMTATTSQVKDKSAQVQPVQHLMKEKKLNGNNLGHRGPPAKAQVTSTNACLDGVQRQSTKPMPSNKSKSTKVSKKAIIISDSSEPDEPIAPRAGPRPQPKKYVISESSESSSSLVGAVKNSDEEPDPSDSESSDSPSPLVKERVNNRKRPKVQRTGRRAPQESSDSDDTNSNSASSIVQQAASKPFSSPLSSLSDFSLPTAPARNTYMATPQLKASHLRQARYRQGTPFRRVPRISLASTINTPGSVLPPPFQTSTPQRRPVKIIDLSTSSEETGLEATSSPLTWEHTLTPEAVRLQSLPPPTPTSELSDEEFSSEGESLRALTKLLEFSAQQAPLPFSDFLETFKARELDTLSNHGPRGKSRTVQRASLKYRKIGDASYSEVFGIGDVVMKIIPLALEIEVPMEEQIIDPDEEVPFKSSLEGVLKEITITKAAGDAHDGFVKLLRTYVIVGKYPKTLLKEWDEFKRDRGSDGIRPDSFNDRQLYAIIVLPHAGVDLETYTFAKTVGSSKLSTVWRDAAEIFWQVASSLASAEQSLRFEHRDLHWGQIVVRKSAKSEGAEPVINATIIDLGLSRLEENGDVHFSVFEDEVFTGRGVLSNQQDDAEEGLGPDYQFDVYRMMKNHNGNDWAPFDSLTNAMWLHYLSVKLLKHKGLRKPTSSTRQSTFNKKTIISNVAGTHLDSEWQAYQHLVNVERRLEGRLRDVALALTDAKGEVIRSKPIVKGKGAPGTKTNGPSEHSDSAISLDSAADVVLLWLTKDW